MKALVAGPQDLVGQLAAGLAERGVEAEPYEAAHPGGERTAADLAGALVELERRLPGATLAIAVGAGDAPTAIAVTAAKLGVPLAAWAGQGEEGSELDRAELRIIATLAGCDAGLDSAAEAAERIASWALLDLGR